MEQRIRLAGVRWAMVRLPEFYGPSVVTLTARVFRAHWGPRPSGRGGVSRAQDIDWKPSDSNKSSLRTASKR